MQEKKLSSLIKGEKIRPSPGGRSQNRIGTEALTVVAVLLPEGDGKRPAGQQGLLLIAEARGANEFLRMARPWYLNGPVPPTTALEPRLKQVQTSRLPSAVTMTALSGDAVCR